MVGFPGFQLVETTSFAHLTTEVGMKLSLQTWKDGKEVTIGATETSEVVQHPWGFFVIDIGSN